MNKIHNTDGKLSNISLNMLNKEQGKKAQKVKDTIDFYVGQGKQYKTYDDLLESLLVLQKINLEMFYKDFVPSHEFWSFTYAGERQTSSKNKMKNVPI